jgi:hypothetical protein
VRKVLEVALFSVLSPKGINIKAQGKRSATLGKIINPKYPEGVA